MQAWIESRMLWGRSRFDRPGEQRKRERRQMRPQTDNKKRGLGRSGTMLESHYDSVHDPPAYTPKVLEATDKHFEGDTTALPNYLISIGR